MMSAKQLFHRHVKGYYIHPTAIVNALIELENSSGPAGLRQFRQELAMTQQQINEQPPATAEAEACAIWSAALHTYICQHQLWAVLEETQTEDTPAFAKQVVSSHRFRANWPRIGEKFGGIKHVRPPLLKDKSLRTVQ